MGLGFSVSANNAVEFAEGAGEVGISPTCTDGLVCCRFEHVLADEVEEIGAARSLEVAGWLTSRLMELPYEVCFRVIATGAFPRGPEGWSNQRTAKMIEVKILRN